MGSESPSQRLQADLPRKRTGVARYVRRAVVREPLNRLRRYAAVEPPFDGLYHQIAHHVAADAAGSGYPTHRLPVAAVERKRDSYPLPVVAGDLESIGAPTAVAGANRDSAIVAACVDRPSGMSPKQQPMLTHDAIDALVIDPALPVRLRAGG